MKAIEDAHAGFLYVDELCGEGKEVFEPILAEGEEFGYGCLYQVVSEDDGIRLVRWV